MPMYLRNSPKTKVSHIAPMRPLRDSGAIVTEQKTEQASNSR